jgi:hypothetical protein
MKITKKMRKRIKGMNHATREAYRNYKPVTYNRLTGWSKQITYVNPENFGLKA